MPASHLRTTPLRSRISPQQIRPFGRWLNADPAGLAGGLNLYAYVGDNPISGIDPLGLVRWGLLGKSVVGVVANGTVVVVGGALAETGVGAVAAVYAAYGLGANLGNIGNALIEHDAAPTGPAQTLTAIAFSNSKAAQNAGQIADLVVPILAGGFNPAEVADASALIIAKDASAGYNIAKGLITADQIADAGFTLGETVEQITAELNGVSATAFGINTALVRGSQGGRCP